MLTLLGSSGLSKDQVILEVIRKSGKFKDEAVTFGTIIQVLDTEEG